MTIPNEILENYGPDINTNNQTDDSNSTATTYSSSDDQIEERINSLWDKPQGNNPDGNQQPIEPQVPQQPTQTQQTPTAPTNQAQPVIDPVKQFEEASLKAFITDSGELDANKINDFYLTNGKSFMKLVEPQTAIAQPVEKPQEKPDPDKEYQSSITEVIENFDAIVQDQVKAGYSHEQAMQIVSNYLQTLKTNRQNALDIRAAIEQETKKYASKFEEDERNALNAKIESNITEFSQGLDNLIPGLNGRQVLNHFVLNPKYGGDEVLRLFNKENPQASQLPQDQQDSLKREWFQKFQSDKAELARVAEFGRLKWQVENFKPILEHAQRVGAAKVQMQREGTIGAPSGLTQQQRATGQSLMEKFFSNDNYDSVN